VSIGKLICIVYGGDGDVGLNYVVERLMWMIMEYCGVVLQVVIKSIEISLLSLLLKNNKQGK